MTRRSRPVPTRAARRAVEQAIAIAARGPEPMDQPWPLTSQDPTGKEVQR